MAMNAVQRFAMVVSCAVISACGSGGTNPATPSGTSYEGQWSGTTAQGEPIALTISSDQKVTAITVGYRFNGCAGMQAFSNLSIDTVPNVTCIPGPCSPLLSSFRAFGYSAGSSDAGVTIINGRFPSASQAEGVAGFTNYPGCGTVLGVGWTATRR